MLLGCANSKMSVATERLKAEFTVIHPLQQVDLVRWKATEIERLFAVKVRYAQQQCFSFAAERRVRIIHQWFYRGERKAITPKIRFMDHPIGLAMLLCDRGNIHQSEKPSITLTVDFSTASEVNLLLSHIQTLFRADGYLKTTHRAKTLFEIEFNPENSQIVWEGVKRWIPQVSSMQSKFQDMIQYDGQ